jgi:hypothetical protein
MPAVIYNDGGCEYYFYGLLHRKNDKPASIWKDSTQLWYRNDLLHRDNNPAIIFPDGRKQWYRNGNFLMGDS